MHIHRAQEGDYSLIHELMEVTFIHHLPHIYPLSFPPYFCLISLLFSLLFSALFPPYFRCCPSRMMNRARRRRTSGIKRLHCGLEVRGGSVEYILVCVCCALITLATDLFIYVISIYMHLSILYMYIMLNLSLYMCFI